MPPKKKGQAKKKELKQQEHKTLEFEGPTEKEVLLQNELDQLNDELASIKKQVEDLRKENDWLQIEAEKVKAENHEYMTYMEKKTSKRQTAIVTLSDQNQKEIEDIKKQKEEMLADYEKKKQALREILLDKEHLLSKCRRQLDDLSEYKELQSEQMSRIGELEKEVMEMRVKHSETISKLKSKYLEEKNQCQRESDAKISAMANQAAREAMSCLSDHTTKIKLENRALRHELLLLIRKTRALQEHKKQLEQQQKQLLVEQQYARDLKTLRSARQHKVLKSFGMLEGAGGKTTTRSATAES